MLGKFLVEDVDVLPSTLKFTASLQLLGPGVLVGWHRQDLWEYLDSHKRREVAEGGHVQTSVILHQTSGHILKYGDLCGEGDVGEETGARDLGDVWVAELGALVLRVDESVMEFLPRVDQSADIQLLHSPVVASAQLPTGRPHVGDDVQTKLRRVLWHPLYLLSRDCLPSCYFLYAQ